VLLLLPFVKDLSHVTASSVATIVWATQQQLHLVSSAFIRM
jgi:hypothetical protein